ncbi:hypothetical protein APE_0297 [Aeropyrum pernix K1]|uniref:Uncharacterized protein n=1 Tax=Aeropyrum pernix (strain ATCC 700893 / DSM 11879 / JCM 9820 / NBRC 100138 / K1) TaxID=272557 RepID=Q9YFE4_AERPE|nr:hypothetical protein [Aeropyrum pernix]BAA79252.1 hypothetical protein APE_0297 [Aeropyrum pernix K1]
MSFEERLERIERLLAEVLQRLRRIEEMAEAGEQEARMAAEMAMAFTLPIHEALSTARRVARAVSRLDKGLGDDGIAKAIVEALAVNGPLTLRGLEREVRRLRGTASRRVIRERLRALERLGIVEVERRGRRLVIKLATD